MDARRLAARLAAQEAHVRPCLAPCVRGGHIRVRLEGLVQTFRTRPAGYSGWGIFHLSGKHAIHQGDADLDAIERYLLRLPSCPLRLAYRLGDGSWLSWPDSSGDFRTRYGPPAPQIVHLVRDCQQFDVVVARRDGNTWWYDQVLRSAPAEAGMRLQQALTESVPPLELRFSGLTPDMRTAYRIAIEQSSERHQARLRQALALGGATLGQFREQGDMWLVTWSTGDGIEHESVVAPRDLTVVSAGICLSDGDSAFDLQSLPGVVEGQ